MSEPGTSPPLEQFLRRHGISDYDRLVERAAREPEWFWAAVMEFHGLHFFKPYERLLDVSKGPEWAEWCVGGTTNLAYNCLDRTIANGHAQKPAILWEGEDGSRRSMTYAELATTVSRAAGGLASLGIRQGEVVGLSCPGFRGHRRIPGRGEYRRDRLADVLRLRGPGCGRAPVGRRSRCSHHGRPHLSPRQADRDGSGDRLGRRRGADFATCGGSRARPCWSRPRGGGRSAGSAGVISSPGNTWCLPPSSRRRRRRCSSTLPAPAASPRGRCIPTAAS